MSGPKTSGPAGNIPPAYVDPDSWTMYNSLFYPDSEVDRDLDAHQWADEGVLFMTPDTISLNTSHSVAGPMSPTESISTPERDGGASSYATPSTMYYGSPQCTRTLPGLEDTISNQAGGMTRLINDRSRQTRTTPVAIRSNETTLHLLQSCKFGQGRVLEEKRIQKVLEAEAHLATQDPCEMLRPQLNEWDNNMRHGLHALGLPALWKGVQGAIDYVRVLDADETERLLDPVARRIGQVLLNFNYDELCKHPEEYCPPSTSKPSATSVLNCIIDGYPDDPRILMSRQSRRNKISGYHVRRGRWWWKLAGILGVGILLIGDSSLISIMCVTRLAHFTA